MTKLSPEAQQLLDQGRDALTPDAAAKERILNSLDASLASGSAVAGSSGFAVGKLWLALALVAGIGGGWFLFRQDSEPSKAEAVAAAAPAVEVEATPEPEPQHEVAPEPVREATPEPESEVVHEPKAVPKPKGTPKNISKKPASKASNLLAERKLLSAAQRAIRGKNYQQARDLLAQHKREFPRGLLRPERQAATAMANCLDENGKSGKAIARRFLEAHPSSPLAPRVRKSCELE